MIETAIKTDGGLLSGIEARTARIAILGLGYVGLPMAMEFVRAGFSVTGINVDPERCSELAAGRSYIADLTDDDSAARLRPSASRRLPTCPCCPRRTLS